MNFFARSFFVRAEMENLVKETRQSLDLLRRRL